MPEEPTPRFTMNIDIVERCALAYRKHGILPVSGGLLDQPERLYNEMMLYLAIFEYQNAVIDEIERLERE